MLLSGGSHPLAMPTNKCGQGKSWQVIGMNHMCCIYWSLFQEVLDFGLRLVAQLIELASPTSSEMEMQFNCIRAYGFIF